MEKENLSGSKNIFFAQVPTELLRNPKIPMQAKALFGVLHSHCREKDLRKGPRVVISQLDLAKSCGTSTVTIWKWLKCLEDLGWISVRRGGKGRPNEYTLIQRRRNRRTDLREKYFRFSKREEAKPILEKEE